MYLPALVLGVGAHRRRRRAASADGAAFSRALRSARSRRAALPVPLRRRRRSVVLARAFARDHVADRRAVSCAGSPGARRSASGRSRSATRCRGRSASIRRWRCSSPRCRSASCRWRLRRRSCATGCATSRSSSSAASPTRRSSAPAPRSTWRCCKLVGFVFADDADPHNWIVALLATLVVVLLAQPVKEAVQNALDRVFYRDRYDYRRALVGFARDLNSDLDVVRLSQRLVTRIVETLVVDRMALMLADERLGDFRTDRRLRLRRSRCRACTRSSSFIARLDGGHTVALDDPIAGGAVRRRGGRVLARPGHLLLRARASSKASAIAVLALGRKETDEPFNSEDLGAADGGRRPGRDRDRERPAVPAAAPQGRRARPDARVQREHPRVARRRAGRVRRATSGSSAGITRSRTSTA